MNSKLRWVRYLWPSSHELLIARRYLFRYRRNRLLTAVAVMMTLATVAIEAHYFLWPGHKSFTAGMVALLAPLFSIGALLLNALSVFSTVAVIGVMLGVAALNVVMAVTSGFQGEIRTRVIGLNAHILVLKYGLDFQDYETVIKKLAAYPDGEVLASSPFVYNEMLLAKEGSRTAGVLVKGIDVTRAQQVMNLNRWMQPGLDGQPTTLAALGIEQAANDGGPPLPAIFIGRELQRKLKLRLGDRVRLISPLTSLDLPPPEPPDAPPEGKEPPKAPAKEPAVEKIQPAEKADAKPRTPGDALTAEAPANNDAATRSEAPPRLQEFRLAGVFSAGFDEYDRRLALVALPRAQELVGQGNTVTGIEMRIKHVDRARPIGDQLVKYLGGPPFRSLDWEELNHNLFTALALQKAVLTLVLFFIIVVAAFNIVASLTMMVVEKTREVAILKAMGMSGLSVSSVFRAAGMWIGTLGVSLGIVMGLLVCALVQRLGYLLDAKVYMIDRLPTHLAFREVAFTGLATLIICLAATLYPAVRAARLNPVDGLRAD